MIKQLPKVFIMQQQFNDASDHAQFGACRATRAHAPQPTISKRVPSNRATEFRQHGEGNSNQSEHACPRLAATDACMMKTEQSFGITKAFLTTKAPRVLLRHPNSRQVAVRHQVPDSPPSVAVTRPRLHQKDLSRIARGLPEATPGTTALILSPAQGIKPAPTTFNSHMVVRLRADDVRNAQFIEQIKQINISKPAVCRQDKAPPCHATHPVMITEGVGI